MAVVSMWRSSMGSSLTWIVTRAEPEVGRTVQLLRNSQLDARPLPCIARVWNPWPAWPESSVSQRRMVFVTSAAVAAAIPTAERFSIAALSPSTSAMLRERRIAVDIATFGGSVALARAVRKWAAANNLGANSLFVRYPASDLASMQPEHAEAVGILSERATVEAFEFYRTVAPELLGSSLQTLNSTIDGRSCGWIFASPSAVDQFAAHGGFALNPARSVVLIGESTARTWRDRRSGDWPHAVLHDQANPLPRTLHQIEEQLR